MLLEAIDTLANCTQHRFNILLDDFAKDRVMSCFIRIIVADMFPMSTVRTLSTQQVTDICMVDNGVKVKKAELRDRRQKLETALEEFRNVINQPGRSNSHLKCIASTDEYRSQACEGRDRDGSCSRREEEKAVKTERAIAVLDRVISCHA